MVFFLHGLNAFTPSAQANEIITQARQLREQGDFKQAEAVLSAALKNDDKLSASQKKDIAYEVDLLERAFNQSRRRRIDGAPRHLESRGVDLGAKARPNAKAPSGGPQTGLGGMASVIGNR